MNLAMVNARKPDKHRIGPPGPMRCLQLGYESGRGKHKQTSSSHDGALRTIQSLELGYEPCPGERKQA